MSTDTVSVRIYDGWATYTLRVPTGCTVAELKQLIVKHTGMGGASFDLQHPNCHAHVYSPDLEFLTDAVAKVVRHAWTPPEHQPIRHSIPVMPWDRGLDSALPEPLTTTEPESDGQPVAARPSGPSEQGSGWEVEDDFSHDLDYGTPPASPHNPCTGDIFAPRADGRDDLDAMLFPTEPDLQYEPPATAPPPPCPVGSVPVAFPPMVHINASAAQHKWDAQLCAFLEGKELMQGDEESCSSVPDLVSCDDEAEGDDSDGNGAVDDNSDESDDETVATFDTTDLDELLGTDELCENEEKAMANAKAVADADFVSTFMNDCCDEESEQEEEYDADVEAVADADFIATFMKDCCDEESEQEEENDFALVGHNGWLHKKPNSVEAIVDEEEEEEEEEQDIEQAFRNPNRRDYEDLCTRYELANEAFATAFAQGDGLSEQIADAIADLKSMMKMRRRFVRVAKRARKFMDEVVDQLDRHKHLNETADAVVRARELVTDTETQQAKALSMLAEAMRNHRGARTAIYGDE
jgi:hypothetical protein